MSLAASIGGWVAVLSAFAWSVCAGCCAYPAAILHNPITTNVIDIPALDFIPGSCQVVSAPYEVIRVGLHLAIYSSHVTGLATDPFTGCRAHSISPGVRSAALDHSVAKIGTWPCVASTRCPAV